MAVRLAEQVPDVTGIDADIVALARSGTDANVSWIVGDVLTSSVARYDVVAAVAVVHYCPDLTAGLRRLADLTAPGGVLVVIGCARSSRPADFAWDAVGVVQHRILSHTRGFWQHNAPVQKHTYTEVKDIATAVLPGMTWRRLPLWRYAITWRKPESVLRPEVTVDARCKIAVWRFGRALLG